MQRFVLYLGRWSPRCTAVACDRNDRFFCSSKDLDISLPKEVVRGSGVLELGSISLFQVSELFCANFLALVDVLHPVDAVVRDKVTTWSQIALPLGISFFVFETISYLTDVYRRRQEPARKWADYALYLAFFPHLIAGPIYRFSDIAADLDTEARTKKMTSSHILQGLFIFCVGLGKKVLIANPMAAIADKVFDSESSSFCDVWLGALAYAFQIFFDFSGYSTMAIGLAAIFGFCLPKNFNAPYTATSITDFWRRWHMSLSHWFRDYLYIPLGGNQRGTRRTYYNLMLVFILCGLWHGSQWNFALWGLYHGFFLVFERARTRPLMRHLPEFCSQGASFIIVVFGWVIFRAASVPRALAMMQGMIGLQNFKLSPDLLVLIGESPRFGLVALLACTSFFSTRNLMNRFETTGALEGLKAAIAVGLFFFCILELATNSFNPFIYFRF